MRTSNLLQLGLGMLLAAVGTQAQVEVIVTVTAIATSTTSSTVYAYPTAATSSISSSSGSSSATTKPVFFHYMIGSIEDSHCHQDIVDAKALGVDAFALNLDNDQASWAIDTVDSLFNWAETLDFKLFFSFDMSGFNNPDQFTSFLEGYLNSTSYFQYHGLPLVSTYNGGALDFTFGQGSVNDGWKVNFVEPLANAGHQIYFVPSFPDAPSGASNFFNIFSAVDGAFNWNSWAWESAGKVPVPTTDDVTYQQGALANGKSFLMGISPLQFKHIDAQYNNYYRRGEQNLEVRLGQVLAMQPDMIEFQTWNDAGESHYMGNIWPEPIVGTPIPAYTSNYDHTGYWEIIPAFVKAYKSGATSNSTMVPTNGKAAQGVFWHHTLLTTGSCGGDSMGLPVGAQTAEDRVSAVVLVESGEYDLTATVTSGYSTLTTQALSPGFNSISVLGLGEGNVTLTVSDSTSTVVSGTGPISVTTTASLCNYNFQVVALQ